MVTRDQLFRDQIFVKIPLGIQIGWKFISEGVNKYSINTRFFLFIRIASSRPCSRVWIWVDLEKAGPLDTFLKILCSRFISRQILYPAVTSFIVKFLSCKKQIMHSLPKANLYPTVPVYKGVLSGKSVMLVGRAHIGSFLNIVAWYNVLKLSQQLLCTCTRQQYLGIFRYTAHN